MIRRQRARSIGVSVAGLLLAASARLALAQPPALEAEPATRSEPATAAEAEPAPDAAAKKPEEPPRTPREETGPEGAALYVPPPPERRVPGGRVGGSTRGPASCAKEILALVPEDHVGLTRSAQPTLYWFVGEDTTCRIDFVLNDPRATMPRVERQLAGPHAAGIHSLSLADFGVSLDAGIVYDWSVAIVTDPDARSKDLLSGGQIERIDAPEDAGRSPAADHARSLGQRGLWYDAVAALERGIVASPQNAAEERVAASRLLASQGLGAAASREADRVDVAAPPPPPP